MEEQVIFSKRIKLDIDDTNDDVIIIDSSINNSVEAKSNIIDALKTNTFTLSNTSKLNDNVLSNLSPIPPFSPDIIIDDDDIIEIGLFTKKLDSDKSSEFVSQKSIASTNIDPIVINLSPSASSSESHSSQTKSKNNRLSRHSKKVYRNYVHNFNHPYCVTVDPSVSYIFEPVMLYKKKYEKEFKKFNKQIWNNLSINLQVIIY